jgi:DNA-binding transcriptional regulator YdaS (Cro superfamily)
MNLIDYTKDLGGTGVINCPVLATLAAAAECSHQTLYMIALRHKQAGPKLALRIEAATGGRVPKSELRPDLWPPEVQPSTRKRAA